MDLPLLTVYSNLDYLSPSSISKKVQVNQAFVSITLPKRDSV